MRILDSLIASMRNSDWLADAHDKGTESGIKMPLPPIFQGEMMAHKQMPITQLNAFFTAQLKMSQEGAAEFLEDIAVARGANYRSIWD